MRRVTALLASALLTMVMIGGAHANEHSDQVSAAALYNLGNAYLREGKPGLAIASYERARVLEPHASDIATNLAFARTAAGLPVQPPPIHARFFALLSVRQWTFTLMAAFWLLCGCAGYVALAKSKRYHGPTKAIFAASALVALVSGGVLLHEHAYVHEAIVVAAHETPARLSPFDGARVEGNLSEGQRVVVQGRHGTFVRVHSESGLTGWVDRGAIETILPNT